MALKLKQKLHDDKSLRAILDEIVDKICNEPYNFSKLAFIGILTTGAPLAKYLARKVGEKKDVSIPVAFVDITLYRDDHIDTPFDPYSRKTEIPFPVTNREVILVDDVLFTGRTVRAALTSILELGRPKLIRLAVAVDRGHRELPIHADYTGLTINTVRDQGIRVRVNDPNQENGIYIFEEDEDSTAESPSLSSIKEG